jgi:hypothetical protein
LLLLASVFPATPARADSLTISTSPPGATIEINGLPAGTTPFKIDYPGGYFHKPHAAFSARLEHALTIHVSKEGYLSQQVTLTNGPFDWVAITGRRRGSYFLLKSEHFEIKLEPISYSTAGRPTETIGRDGPMRPPSESMFRGNADEHANATDAGSVAIASDPPNADIYIDGNFVGQTPSALRLSSGAHRVEVRAKGKQPWARDLNVLKDSQLTLHAVFAD